MTIENVASLPFAGSMRSLPYTESLIVLGSDLALWITSGKSEAGGIVSNVPQVYAVNSDGESLGVLAQGVHVKADGATLALLADLARRAFPNHARLDDAFDS